MATTSQTPETGSKRQPDSRPAETVRSVADSVAGAAGEMTARIPDITRSSQELIQDATRAVQAGSEPTLRLVGAMTVGLAVGLLAAGANRFLVLASLIPGALIGLTLLDRRDTNAPTRGAAGRVQGA